MVWPCKFPEEERDTWGETVTDPSFHAADGVRKEAEILDGRSHAMQFVLGTTGGIWKDSRKSEVFNHDGCYGVSALRMRC